MPIIKEEKLTNFDPTNFGQVKQEVTAGVYQDWKRDKVDDAKKRAIYSAPTYDDFKALVAGCTLKPIGRSEFNAPPKSLSMNSMAKSADENDETKKIAALKIGESEGSKKSAKKLTIVGFEKLLRRSGKKDENKIKFLSESASLFSEVCESDPQSIKKADPDFLLQLLELLCKSRQNKENESEFVAEYLKIIVNGGGSENKENSDSVAQLKFALDFAGKSQKAFLFEHLTEWQDTFLKK